MRRIVSAAICPMNWTQIVSAISALMIVVRVKNVERADPDHLGHVQGGRGEQADGPHEPALALWLA